MAMAAIFNDLKAGLDEIDAFLAGKRIGYRVSVPAEIDIESIRKGLDSPTNGSNIKSSDSAAPRSPKSSKPSQS
jgi:hypothetical protein